MKPADGAGRVKRAVRYAGLIILPASLWDQCWDGIRWYVLKHIFLLFMPVCLSLPCERDGEPVYSL